jgi:hypothetical protein
MGIDESHDTETQPLFVHPSVETWGGSGEMTSRQRVAAVAKVRCLEHNLFEGDRVRRELNRKAAERILAEINQLRSALGWLKIDLDSRWRRCHHGASTDTPPATLVEGAATIR